MHRLIQAIKHADLIHVGPGFILFSSNIFYSEEKDWVWHKTWQGPLQKKYVQKNTTMRFYIFGNVTVFQVLIRQGMAWSTDGWTDRQTDRQMTALHLHSHVAFPEKWGRGREAIS